MTVPVSVSSQHLTEWNLKRLINHEMFTALKLIHMPEILARVLRKARDPKQFGTDDF